jgi:hypothetical protein
MSKPNNKHTSVSIGNVAEQKQNIALANDAKRNNVVNIPVDNKIATEASQALAISDKKEQEKKVDITSNEHTFLTWFMLYLQKLLESKKDTTHGMCLEKQKYEILFHALSSNGYSLTLYGTPNNCARVDFPKHVEGKTKVVNGVTIYSAIKDKTEFKVFDCDKKRYIHYVGNLFHVFHVAKQATLSISEERETLKKIDAIESVKREQEKQVASATKEVKK